MYNQITLVGNVGKVEPLRHTPNGDAVFNFSVATSNGKGDAKKTTWWRVTVWSNYGDTMSKVIGVGNKVLIIGTLDVTTDVKNGTTYVNLNVTANKVLNMSARDENAPSGNTSMTTDERINPNDIPF